MLPRRRLRCVLSALQRSDAGGDPCTRFYDGLPVMDNFHYETVEHFRGVHMKADDVTLVTFP